MSRKSKTSKFMCYAGALGDCEGAMSREHYVTEGGLELIQAPVSGAPRVYQKKKGIRRIQEIGKLAERILCVKHNRDLTFFDQTFIDLIRATEAMHIAGNNCDLMTKKFEIDGDRLERWMLKTLIGGLYSGELWDDLGCLTGKAPPLEWLETLYRGHELPSGQGIYLQPTEMPGLSLEDRDEIEVLPWLSGHSPAQQTVIGLHLWIFGFHLVLLVANASPNSVAGFHRPEGLVLASCNKSIEFKWKVGTPSP